MKITKRFCYKHSSGEDIYLFALCNAKGTEVLISNFGAIITSFKIKMEGTVINDIVLGFDAMEDYTAPAYLDQYPWFGAAIGRYANRVGNGHFTIGEKNYALTLNRPGEHLHGGIGFDKKIWRAGASGNEPLAFLELQYESADGEDGYPGNLDTTIRFELNDNDELSYTYSAVTDETTAINLTHHSYFNLNNGRGNVYDHEIRIPASNILAQEANLVANGNLVPVKDNAYDFTHFRKISTGFNEVGFYDQSFVLDQPGNGMDTVLVAEARSLLSKILLQVYSTEPVVHFYSGKWIPAVKGKQGIIYGAGSGFCLETQKHPNAINIPHFPNTVLRPGEKYYQKTIYRVSSF